MASVQPQPVLIQANQYSVGGYQFGITYETTSLTGTPRFSFTYQEQTLNFVGKEIHVEQTQLVSWSRFTSAAKRVKLLDIMAIIQEIKDCLATTQRFNRRSLNGLRCSFQPSISHQITWGALYKYWQSLACDHVQEEPSASRSTACHFRCMAQRASSISETPERLLDAIFQEALACSVDTKGYGKAMKSLLSWFNIGGNDNVNSES